MDYQILKDVGKGPNFYTEEMECERQSLETQLREGADGPDFPWDRYEGLVMRRRTLTLPEDYESLALERLRGIVGDMKDYYKRATRALLVPLTEANAAKQVRILEGLKVEKDRMDDRMKQHYALADIERELFGLPVTISSQAPAPSPWAALLIGSMPLEAFYKFLSLCGLITQDGELTELGRAEGEIKARKAPWAGTLKALMSSGILDDNADAVCAALYAPSGRLNVKMNAGTLRDLSRKALTYFDSANVQLEKLQLLRK